MAAGARARHPVGKHVFLERPVLAHSLEGLEVSRVGTASEVKVDAKVTVEGRVALNRDVGLGAPYPVVVESATVREN